MHLPVSLAAVPLQPALSQLALQPPLPSDATPPANENAHRLPLATSAHPAALDPLDLSKSRPPPGSLGGSIGVSKCRNADGLVGESSFGDKNASLEDDKVNSSRLNGAGHDDPNSGWDWACTLLRNNTVTNSQLRERRCPRPDIHRDHRLLIQCESCTGWWHFDHAFAHKEAINRPTERDVHMIKFVCRTCVSSKENNQADSLLL
jgi:hypothetical protein